MRIPGKLPLILATALAMSARLSAQSPDLISLKNWQAPLSWQATTPEEIAAAPKAPLGRAPKSELSAPGSPALLGMLVSITPCRLVDTRSAMPQPYGAGTSTPLAWAALSYHTIPATGLPPGAYPPVVNPCIALPLAQAYSANVTVWPQPFGTTLRWLSVCPTGTAPATCSGTATLTGYEGGITSSTSAIISNAAVIPANSSGSFDVFVTESTWVIIDINGYYVSPNALALGAGATASPSLTFSNDTNSGLYSPSAGTVKMTSSGVDRLTVNSSGIAVNGALDLTGNLSQGGNTLLQTNGTNLGLGFSTSVAGADTTAVGYHALTGNTAANNTAVGSGALQSNTTGTPNTAVGAFALKSNTTGSGNTGAGFAALQFNTTGNLNTAIGSSALLQNTGGTSNTAVGNGALLQNTTGNNNTAAGYAALVANKTGGNNVGVGYGALGSNTTGASNTATGMDALTHNTSGLSNVANGQASLQANTIGNGNTALGTTAMTANISGANNTAIGTNALFNNTTGNNNLAVGINAAFNVSPGNNNNIHIGSMGAAGDSGTIRIGDTGSQTSFFAAGINGATTLNNNAVQVLIDSGGQLGTISSSRRFKQDIQDMGAASRGLMQLRPVTFRYRQPSSDGSRPVQYGLIAEEVAEIFPDLVAHSADGQIQTVKYQVLDSMLLNEIQRQQREISGQQQEIRDLRRELSELKEALLSARKAGGN